MFNFGITIKPDPAEMTPERIVALTRQAEAAGFSYGWLFDSHVLWLEPYPLLTMMALNTTGMRLGTCVTNPAVRDPTVTASALATLNQISGGRMDLGIGRGDSSRRVLGEKPTTLATLEAAVQTIRHLAEGEPALHEDEQIRLTWAQGRLPVWIAGYGPKALHLTGRIADGVILQFADPHLIKWCLGFLHEGARAAGRDPASIQVMAASPVWVSDDLATAREHVRWFPALVSNHVMDLIARYDAAELPAELTAYVKNRPAYDYQHHAEVGSDNSRFVSDDVVDAFCIVGPVEEHKRRLRELADLGVHQFNIYLMCGEEEATLDVYGREILPEFGATVADKAKASANGRKRRAKAPTKAGAT
jgi:probable F420-dependent oxidoreductase